MRQGNCAFRGREDGLRPGGRRLCAYVTFTLRRRIFTPPLTVVQNLTSAVGYGRRSAASAQCRRESRIRTGGRSGLDLKEIGLNGSGTTPALRMLTGVKVGQYCYCTTRR